MRKIIAFYSGPFAGTDSCAAFVVDNRLTDDQIVRWLEPWAWDEHDQWADEDSDEFEEEGPDYHFEDYNPEKHDMLRVGGGSFEDDFYA